MKKTAEVIIIGAGIIGTSIAYHLAKLGCLDVIVLEKEDTIGTGSTAKASGGVRQQFSNEVNIRLSMESIKSFECFEEEIGSPIDFHRNGYLRLVSTEEELEWLQQAVDLEQKLGVKVYLISAEEAKYILPALSIDGLLGASYCPTDGGVDAYSMVQGYSYAARSLGAKIYTNVEVISIKTDVHKVKGVVSSEGEITAPFVVNAAGPYASRIGNTVDINIPVYPHKMQTFVSAPTDEIQKGAPHIVDVHYVFGLHKEGLGIILNGADPDQPVGYDITVDWSYLPKLAERILPRLPFVANLGIMRAQAGLHPDTPDKSAILGSVSGLEGLYLACGFNSQGIMHAPAAGRIMAEYILGIGCDPAISLLRLSRFKDGALQQEGFVSKGDGEPVMRL